jgi:hypothetical protein
MNFPTTFDHKSILMQRHITGALLFVAGYATFSLIQEGTAIFSQASFWQNMGILAIGSFLISYFLNKQTPK